ncbi:PilC/PilY family type IV pilus protein [Marinagarivorans algicola]|uniref:PilC/PilY family type IV pilus protein n=1 Tax=Marinagarivorans algicola TaxID=1513270 RepID=UPI0006B96585|nr:PilC/PilY family type IV pilus protein [Marinagarivorans algicola]
MKIFNKLLTNGLACLILLLPAFTFAHNDSANFTAAPPFVATNVGKPNVVIALDISGSMKQSAYSDTRINWKSGIHQDFNPQYPYYGYFENDQKYSYSAETHKQFFYADTAGAWDGNYLNWLTMRRMDVVRKVLVGGKVKNRSGDLINGEKWYVLEGQNEPLDYTFKKKYNASSTLSPIPNNAEVLISEGTFSITNNTGGATSVILSDNVEIGTIDTDRDKNESGWYQVTFKNTYDQGNPPAVVATALSYNGSHPAVARVSNITHKGFKVRIDEWDYLDGSHTTEKITFIVAAKGQYTIDIKDKNSTNIRTYPVSAGTARLSSDKTLRDSNNDNDYTRINTAAKFVKPVLFTGVTTNFDNTPVTTRVKDLYSSNVFEFKVAMQMEEKYQDRGNQHGAEDVSWIAIESLSGHSTHSASAIQIGSKISFSSSWKDIKLEEDLFRTTPIIAVNMQSTNDPDPAVVRYGDSEVDSNGFDVLIEEERSNGNETYHLNETIGFLAIETDPAYKIRVAINSEPSGIIQQNSGSVRFGVAVYNYDHSRDPTSIYNGNNVHGGTLRACYPDVSKKVSTRTNFDICLDTHVKSPLSNIIDVIEDHPLIWGTTPIAETLYDIKGYFSQHDFNRGLSKHSQWYDNGTEGTPGQRNSYEISNDWDPYYYSEYSARLPCAKSFVLHFNDGAPYKDFDGIGHPRIKNDGIGSFGTEQVLDDLALMLRQEDCREESGMVGHQEIISYYVYAALGEGEQYNDASRRMREAAANGGFIDNNGDHNPTPPHPENFNSYIKNGNNSCTPNEWDEDGDCNPDTFYFASNAEELVTQLNAALESITARSGSGGAASVIAASRSGEGAVFNAIFRPSVTSDGEEVTWVGDVHALMIDSSGNIRQDNGDGILGDPAADNYIDMCSYDDGELKEVRVKLSSSASQRPSKIQFSSCTKALFDKDLFDLEYLWSGSSWLSSLSDNEAIQQRDYTSTQLGRYIFSGIDNNNDGLVTSSEVIDFSPDSFDESTAGLLSNTVAEAKDIVRFIRGKDIPGYRSRQLNGKTMRLGDIIYSTPTVVGRPAENLDLIYGSTSYQAFFDRYRYRRQVVYAGGNDGMLHAFNGGWFDPETKKFQKAKGSGAPGSSIAFDFGAELWAYAPYNTLTHLEYLTRPNYGSVSSDHLYFVDLEPRIFDAKIFPKDNDHPEGWGTVLVVGSRLGGGTRTLDMDLSATTNNRTLRSSITIFDITNPDKPPKLLLEFTDPQLGFTTAIPAPIVVSNNIEGSGDWYLLLGSGADTTPTGFDHVSSTQKATLFLLDLNNIAAGKNSVLEKSFGNGNGKIQLPDDNSFISDLSAVDFGLDKFTTDAVYFGTVSGEPNNWSGKVYRLLIQENNNETQKPVNQWNIKEVYNPQRPITSPISMTTDNVRNRWLHFGTGRFYTQEDNLDNNYNYFYGLKETRINTGSFTYKSPTKIVDVTNTQVRSDDARVEQPPTLTPPLQNDATIHILQSRMKSFGSNEAVDGWVRKLGEGEKNFGTATIFGGTLTFTTFDPEFDECSVNGDARLYVLNSLTGTAGSPGILVQDNNSQYNQHVVDLGGSPATSPSIHIGDGYTSNNKANAIIQTSDGAITTIEQKNQENIRSGEVSWRELQ